MSSKKRKRLDAYIAKKLKQEEMHESLRIIAANALATPSAPQSSTSSANALSNLEIKSTKTLGQFPFNPLSAQELADRKEDLVVRKAMVGAPIGRKKGRRARAGAYENVDIQDHDSEEEGDKDIAGEEEASEEDERAIKKRKKAERNGIVMDVGSGVPVSASKKPKKTKATSSKSTVKVLALASAVGNLAHFCSFQQSNNTSKPAVESKEESSDFDSSDSENDAPASKSSIPMAKTETVAETKPTLDPPSFEPEPTSTAAAPVVPLGTGSALRRGPNGEVIGPRIVERKPKIKVGLGLQCR